MDSAFIFRVVIVAIAAAIIWQFVRRKYALRIVIIDGRVTSHQGVAKARLSKVVEFLERDVALEGKVTVLGARDASGALRITFRGNVDSGTGQQIRNYLNMIL